MTETAKDGKTTEQTITLGDEEASDLVAQIKASNLSASTQQRLVLLITTFAALRRLLDKRTLSLKAVLKKFFGKKTEKRARSGRRPGEDAAKSRGAQGDGKRRKGGDGRNGKDDFPGAKKVSVKHQCLKPGDPCPACGTGELKENGEAVAYRWSGQVPLIAVMYLLERLICHSCKTTYTAPVPGETPSTSDLDPSVPREGAKPKERAYDATAAATIASLRFEMGVPHFRLAEILAQQGLPLAPSTQYKVMDEGLRKPGEAVFAELEKQAGEACELVINDDTKARVMELERAAKPPEGTPTALAAGAPEKPDRKAVQTSAIVAHAGEHTICLYYTGHANAGENLGQNVLRHRPPDASPPKQMCDGLAANLPEGFVTMLGNCLDHSRRKYNDVKAKFPAEVEYVLSALGAVYAVDAKAKAIGLSDDDRLALHVAESKPVMEALSEWARSGLKEKRIEPNSTLGHAAKYMLKRWDKLTAFLRIAGMPLSNAEVERLIKRCIRHRKNSLHYKTENGARLGDVLMSLIQTCRYEKVSAHEYLTALARYADKVVKAPGAWLPWNFRAAIAALATAPA